MVTYHDNAELIPWLQMNNFNNAGGIACALPRGCRSNRGRVSRATPP